MLQTLVAILAIAIWCGDLVLASRPFGVRALAETEMTFLVSWNARKLLELAHVYKMLRQAFSK